MKSTSTYWMPFDHIHADKWQEIAGTQGNVLECTVAQDLENGDYTRLTIIKAGYDTAAFGAKAHEYPEEIFMIKGRLFDRAFDQWLEPGTYASRPPGEVHGPFVAGDEDVWILEMSYPGQGS